MAHKTKSRTVKIVDPFSAYFGRFATIEFGMAGMFCVHIPENGATVSTTVEGRFLQIVENYNPGFIA